MNICHLTINLIEFERRIKNQAESSLDCGDVVCILASGKSSEIIDERNDNFYLHRITIPFFTGGPLKFIYFNLNVLFFLLFRPLEIMHCHDLWTMPAAIALRLIKKFKLVYDAHEYFAGLEIFNKKKFSKKLWMFVERIAIKRVDILITVSEPIAELYRQKYPYLKKIAVVRNLPKKQLVSHQSDFNIFPVTKNKIILYHGHFRPGRGLIQLIEAMGLIEGAQLMLIGGGELESEIRKRIQNLEIESKISFIGYLPTDQLIPAAAGADLGVVLFEPTSLNYSYALPNKFFEYIMAGLPVLASKIETLEAYIHKYKIGMTVDPSNIQAIAQTIETMLSDEQKLREWRENAEKASGQLNWENEFILLKTIYEQI